MQDQIRNLAPITLLVLFSTILGGYVVLDSPFRTLRKPAKVHRGYTHSSHQEVDARLWQDPLAVVHDAVKGREEDRKRIELPRLIYEETKDLEVLLVTLPGGPYAEDGETRRRNRHAVLAGLAESNFVPEDSEHIGYYRLDFPSERSRNNQSVLIPYEWFERTEPKPKKALILWINESAFSNSYAQKLKWLLQTLISFKKPDQSQSEITKPVFTLIGPSSSDSLKDLILTSKNETTNKNQSIIELFFAKELAESFEREFSIWVKNPKDLRASLSTFLDQYQELAFEPDQKNLNDLQIKLAQTIYDNLNTEIVSITSANSIVSERMAEWIKNHEPFFYGSRKQASEIEVNIKIFSNYATASLEYLKLSNIEAVNQDKSPDKINKHSKSQNNAIKAALKKSTDSFINDFETTITRDDVLARKLIDEIIKRRSIRQRLSQNTNKDVVILISEYDTLYGNTFPKLIENTWKKIHPDDAKTIKFDRYGYLRGVDGVVPTNQNANYDNQLNIQNFERQAEAGQTFQTQFDANARSNRRLEIPAGPSQLDYIRRLPHYIHQTSADQRILAIGIIGSDVYDKQLILQSLRPRFPKVLFFTTDLDARLLHPSQYPWTRNLVIASSYGLNLSKDFQELTTPFRDTYQVSTFVAVKRALEDIPSHHESSENSTNSKLDLSLQGELFEVGRGTAYNIGEQPPHSPKTTSPSKRFIDKYKWYLGIGIPIGLFIWFLIPAHIHRNIQINKYSIFRATKATFLFGFTPLLILFMLIQIGKAIEMNGEPLSLFLGISMWPTILISLGAIFGSIYFFIDEYQKISINQKTIRKRYSLRTLIGTKKLKKSSHSKDQKTTISKTNISKVYYSASFIYQKYSPNLHIKIMGKQFPNLVCFSFRAFLLWTLIYSLFLFGNSKPGRGLEILIFSEIILFIGGLCVTYLFVSAFGHAELCLKFLQNLVLKKEVHWPRTTIHKFDPGFSNTETRAIVNDLLDIRMTVDRTKVISNFIIHPFMIALILVLAHNRLFDNWLPSPFLFLYFGILSIMGLYKAGRLRFVAEQAREEALMQADEKWRAATQKTELDHSLYLDLVKEIRDKTGGILQPWNRHPILKAILYPLGALSTLALIDWWMLF